VHVNGLSDSDRAALQSLIPLAGALGAGTIFALFFGGRKRRTELAVFEIFAVAAVFACVATTAYFAIALLHQDEPIGSRDLTRTAAPLLIAAFLLIFISAFGRLEGSTEWILTVLPLALVGVFVALALSALSWEVEPADAPGIAGIIIGVGILFSLGVGMVWRLVSRRDRRRLQSRFAALARLGYRPAERVLEAGLPREEAGDGIRVAGWTRAGHFYIDGSAAERLERRVRRGWDERVDGLSRPALGSTIVLDVVAPTGLRHLRGRRHLDLVLLEIGDEVRERVRPVEPTKDGLFELTDLVEPGSAAVA
jgi:hypothetical protein